jgi:cell division protein FtsL
MYFSLPRYMHWFLVVLALLLTLAYVRVRLNMYSLSYKINENLKKEGRLLDNSRKLRIEAASLKAPSRIENIAAKKIGLRLNVKNKTFLIKKDDTYEKQKRKTP